MGGVEGFLFCLMLTLSHQAKVLLIPGMATSHCLEMMSVGQDLLQRGHQVTLYSMQMEPRHCLANFNTELYKDKFKLYEVKDASGLRQKLKRVNAEMSASIFARESFITTSRKVFSPTISTSCELAYTDKELIHRLQMEKYDIAIVAGIPFYVCFYGIPLLIDTPTVALGFMIDLQDSQTPMQSATLPSIATEYSNEMSFFQRVINTLLGTFFSWVKNLMMPSIDLSKYDKKLAGIDTNQLIKKSVLFIENTDYIVDYPKAIYPNFVQAGALTATPAKPLPDDLKKIMDNAIEEVVLCTFGSVLSSMPMELKQKFMDTFSRLKHQVLFKQDKDEVVGNVRIMKWIPQNDVLGHPNTKLFISHCGKNGFWESVYHGVPIICMAIHAETYTTKVKVRKYGIGSAINIFDDTVEELVKTINDVLSNETISRNMKRKSTLLRDRPETPRQRAASAIEHVLKYGGEHMRPPSVDMNFISFTCLDVWCALFLVTTACIWFDVWLIRKCCCGRKVQKSKTD